MSGAAPVHKQHPQLETLERVGGLKLLTV